MTTGTMGTIRIRMWCVSSGHVTFDRGGGAWSVSGSYVWWVR